MKLLEQTQITPKIIETEAEYKEYLAVAENLIAKKDNRTSEETTLFRLLVKLIEDYEEQFYSLQEWGNLLPHEILQHLLESSGTKAADLVEVINSSQEVILALVSGQRAITKEQAKNLGTYFKVSPSLFSINNS